jgi:predicted transcriptional regulator
MRATVDLPPALLSRVKELARDQQQSLSATLSLLVARGAADFEDPDCVFTDPVSGLPTIRVGRAVTPEEVADLIDEDA